MEYITVEPIMFFVSVTLYLRTPSSQLLILHKVCKQSFNDTVCDDDDGDFPREENEYQAAAAYWTFYLKMALLIPGAVVSSLYGPLSDRLGRRIFFILPSIGNIIGAVGFICQALVPTLPLDYLVASEVVVGLSGNVITAYIVGKSYLCDVTDSTNRTKRIGVMKAMSHVGGPTGALLAGFLIDRLGFASSFYVIIGIHVLLILYVLLWLRETVDYESDQEDDAISDDDEELEMELKTKDGDPETDDEEGDGLNAHQEGKEKTPLTGRAKGSNRAESEDDSSDEYEEKTCDFIRLPLIHLYKSLRMMVFVCFRKRQGSGRTYLLLAMLIGIIHNICSTAESDLTVPYTKHSPLSWSSTTIGIFLSVRTSLKAITLALGMPVIFKLVKSHTVELDLSLATVGIVSTSACLAIIAFATSTTSMMIAAVVGMFVSYPSVAITSFKSKLVESHEYGSLFAVTTLVQTLVSVVGSGLFSNLYATFLPIWPGMPFILTVAFYAVSILIIGYIWWDMKTACNEGEFLNDNGPKYSKVEDAENGTNMKNGELSDGMKTD